jgi:hypothetical protein
MISFDQIMNLKLINQSTDSIYKSFDGVVVITSALHAEGREFDPRSKYFFYPIATHLMYLID